MNVLTSGIFRNLESVVNSSTPEALHHFHSSQWKRPEDIMPGIVEYQTLFTIPVCGP